MTEEFDKEIDALLRQTAQGETASARQNSLDSGFQIPDSNHLDADEISAFAENALPEKAKQRYLLHLADCGACRENLSTLVALNTEQPDAVAHVEEKQSIQTPLPSPLPWYRKLFATPNLAFAMGALVLVFSGIAAYTVLQNVRSSQNAEVSQTYDRQPTGKGMSSDGDATASESYPSSDSYSPSNSAISNMLASNAASTSFSSNSQANLSATPNVPGASAANTSAAMSRNDADNDFRVAAKPFSPAKESTDSAKIDDLPIAGRSMPREKEAELQSDGEVRKQQQPIQMQQSPTQDQTIITPDSSSVKRAPAPSMQRAESKDRKLEAANNDDARKKSVASAATSVGGKSFKRTNNVWYDSAYRGQATVNVARGTGEYKKLDAGLRGIAENLGGTVVVVWKQKAYRIQ